MPGFQNRRSTFLQVAGLGLCAVQLLRSAPALVSTAAGTPEPPVVVPEPEPGFLAKSPLTASLVVYGICVFVAKMEPAAKAEEALPPFEKRKDLGAVFVMAIWLSFLSGIVNAMAIIAMGGTVAHHTGNASHVGRLAGVDATRFASLMVAYLVGAAVAGYCKSNGEALYNRKFSPGMLAAAIAVAAGGVIFDASENALVALPLLSFSQGLQNAICRRCASLPVCTTHMTGYLTDAGMGLGGVVRGEAVPIRTKFFLLSIIAFVVGGTAAKALLDWAGVVTAVVPAIGMALCAFGFVPLPKAAKD